MCEFVDDYVLERYIQTLVPVEMRSAATRLLASRLGTRRSRCITQSFQQQRYIAFDQSSRNSAIRSFFQHLEANYGNLSELIDRGPASETIVSPDGILHPHHLSRLFRHEATALHVQNYYHSADAARLGEEILLESMERTRSGGGSSNWKISTSRGLESSDVGTCGEHTPYNVAVAREYQAATAATATRGKPTALDEYFEGVQREFHSRRKRRCSSKTHDNASDYYQLWPLDKFRLDMDESWPSGAGLARETKQKGDDTFPRPFGGGLPRIMYGPTRWKRGFIHVDEMGPLNIHKGLFSANIYLKLPEKGSIKDAGDLYIWPLGVRSRWDWYRNAIVLSGLSAQDPETQILLHQKLGEPNIIRPKPGDLVLLCAQRPHCAVGFNEGVRVSLQCFLQYDGLRHRLLIDC